MKNSIIARIANMTILTAFILLLYFFYLQLWPLKIVTLNDRLIPVVHKMVKVDHDVCIELNFTKHLAYKPTIRYYLVNTTIMELTAGGINRPVGTSTTTRCFHIPENTGTGEHHIQIDLSYEITPIRTINYSWDSEPFMVIGGENNE